MSLSVGVNDIDELLARLRQEFIETAHDQIEDIEASLDVLESGQGDAEEGLISIQRHIHNIKGQGATFGFPITGRVAHMLEDYIENASGFGANNIADIRAYLSLMMDLISSGESIVKDNPQRLLNALPTGHAVTFSTQKDHGVNVLLVMPPGLQRKMMVKELLSCGFRVMRAYNSIEALSVAVDIRPNVVFINYDLAPFDGRELCKMFAAADRLHDIHIVLLTSYEKGDKRLRDLPDTVSVVEKRTDFLENISELLIQWGVFGNVPS